MGTLTTVSLAMACDVHRDSTSVPWGFRKLLNYISKRYTAALDIPIWITENGMGVENESSFPLEDKINDRVRQTYYAGYVEAMLQAVLEDGVNVGGYMAWSLME